MIVLSPLLLLENCRAIYLLASSCLGSAFFVGFAFLVAAADSIELVAQASKVGFDWVGVGIDCCEINKKLVQLCQFNTQSLCLAKCFPSLLSQALLVDLLNFAWTCF